MLKARLRVAYSILIEKVIFEYTIQRNCLVLVLLKHNFRSHPLINNKALSYDDIEPANIYTQECNFSKLYL